MIHSQDQIWPAMTATEGGVLLIRHLSSFGTFRANYDTIWLPVGIVNVLRRNSAPAPVLRLAEAQSASASPSRLFSLRRFAYSRDSTLRTSITLRITPLARLKVHPDFMGLSANG